MRSSVTLVLLWIAATPGYKFSFPRDNFSHPEYKTEWWYYTGNLHTKDGRRFGFELTFFRSAMRSDEESTPAWKPNEIWLAHLALSDIAGQKFIHTERLNRSGPGLAGVSEQQARYWNGNWSVQWLAPNGAQQLQAVCGQFTLQLRLQTNKPPVINGRDGVSQKGPKPGEASHYISLTRLQSTGELDYAGQHFQVDGTAWMDHEFFTEQEDTKLAGWDWFAIQLDNNEELMLYRLRLKDGRESPFSSGTFVDARGHSQWLSAHDFSLHPVKNWRSAQSGASYPIAWTITVPKLGLELNEITRLQDQELYGRNSVTQSYWEGAVDYKGSRNGNGIEGVGYLEMTGYGADQQPVF